MMHCSPRSVRANLAIDAFHSLEKALTRRYARLLHREMILQEIQSISTAVIVDFSTSSPRANATVSPSVALARAALFTLYSSARSLHSLWSRFSFVFSEHHTRTLPHTL